MKDSNSHITVLETAASQSGHSCIKVGTPRFELGRPPCKGGIFNHYMMFLIKNLNHLCLLTSSYDLRLVPSYLRQLLYFLTFFVFPQNYHPKLSLYQWEEQDSNLFTASPLRQFVNAVQFYRLKPLPSQTRLFIWYNLENS